MTRIKLTLVTAWTMSGDQLLAVVAVDQLLAVVVVDQLLAVKWDEGS
jgi:hypothetical protein